MVDDAPPPDTAYARARRRRRALLWAALVAMLLVAQTLLVLLTLSYEESRAQDEVEALAAETAVYLEPKDYLNLRLTGRAVSTFDSIVLHWVTDNRDWHRIDYVPELLELAGLSRSKLPDLVAATDPQWMQLEADFHPRGNVHTVVRVSHGSRLPY